MCEGKQYGCSLLADYLTDSFCNAYQKLFAAHNTIIHKVTRKQFLEQLNDLRLHLFDIPQQMIDFAIDKQKEKGRLQTLPKQSVNDFTMRGILQRIGIPLGNDFAVISCEYIADKSQLTPKLYSNQKRSLGIFPPKSLAIKNQEFSDNKDKRHCH